MFAFLPPAYLRRCRGLFLQLVLLYAAVIITHAELCVPDGTVIQVRVDLFSST